MNYKDFITDEQKEKIENFPIEGRWNEFKNYRFNIDVWNKFWTEIYEGDEEDVILDFGSGPAWDCFVAKKLGYENFCNLDIDSEEVRKIFGRYHDTLGVDVKFWDGKTMPFEDNMFNTIVAKASISKLRQTEWDTLLSELARVCKKGATWYISPPYMVSRIPEHNSIKEKEITFQSWDWNRDDKRNWGPGKGHAK